MTAGGYAKAEPCKTFPQAAANDTDVEQSIECVKSNDPALAELNLNNIQVVRDVLSSLFLLILLWLCYFLCLVTILTKSG